MSTWNIIMFLPSDRNEVDYINTPVDNGENLTQLHFKTKSRESSFVHKIHTCCAFVLKFLVPLNWLISTIMIIRRYMIFSQHTF